MICPICAKQSGATLRVHLRVNHPKAFAVIQLHAARIAQFTLRIEQEKQECHRIAGVKWSPELVGHDTVPEPVADLPPTPRALKSPGGARRGRPATIVTPDFIHRVKGLREGGMRLKAIAQLLGASLPNVSRAVYK